MAVRQNRVSSIIKKDVSEIIQFDLKDPSVGFCTITDVNLTNDYSYAKIYVSFIGKQERKQAGLKALNRAKGFVRSELGKRITIRKVPEIIFVLDESLDKAEHLESIIEKTKENI